MTKLGKTHANVKWNESSVDPGLESPPRHTVTWKKASYKMCALISVKKNVKTHI